MNSIIILLRITISTTLVAITICLILTFDNRTKHLRLAEIQKQNKELSAKLITAKSKLDFAEADIHNNAKLEGTPIPKYASPTDAGNAFLAANPKVRELLKSVRHANMAGTFWNIYRFFNLNESQIAEFENIVGSIPAVKKDIPGFGHIALQLENSLDTNKKSERIIELFGESFYKNYISNRQAANSYVNNLALAMAFTETPLTTRQGFRLGLLINGLTIRYNNSNLPMSVDQHWDTIVTQARDILSEPQLVELNRMRVMEHYRHIQRQLSNTAETQSLYSQ